MTGKERVLKTIAHEEPDRVPTGEWGIDHDHVSKILGHHTYWRNRKDSTLAYWDGRRDEVVESLKNDYAELIDKLDYDLLTVELVPPKDYHFDDPPRLVAEDTWQDRAGKVYRYAASNDSIVCVSHDKGREELDEGEAEARLADVKPFDESQFELIDFIVERYGKTKAILCRDIDIYGCLMDPFRGDFNHQLTMTLLAPEEIQKMYPAGLKRNIMLLDELKKRGVDIAMEGKDFGMNQRCMISPDSFREIYAPFMKMVNDEIIKRDMIPFFHCCGWTWDILDDFVKAGYRGYQSIQESAGMDNKRVKEQYGKDLTMWTGVQCETLVSGSIQDTEEEVRRNLEMLMPGGGYIFGSTNSVQYGAKTENYLRALEIVHKEGIY